MDKAIISKINISIHLVLYDVVWILSILTAARGYKWLGLCLALLLISVQVASHYACYRTVKNLIVFTILLTSLGLIVDSTLFSLSYLTFKSNPFTLTIAPPFLWGIWMSFSILIFSVFSNWFNKYFLISMFAFIGFSLAYWAGEKLGAAQSLIGLKGIILIGLIWSILMPLFIMLSNRVLNYDT